MPLPIRFSFPVGLVVPIPILPAFVTTKSEDVAEVAEVEEIENATCVFEVEARCKERFANGEVVPMPTLPSKVVVERREVEEAKIPWVNQMGVEVELAVAPKFSIGVKGKAPPAPVASAAHPKAPAAQVSTLPPWQVLRNAPYNRVVEAEPVIARLVVVALVEESVGKVFTAEVVAVK